MTLIEAQRRCLPGWILRCNLCGEHPALWYPGQRPGWGALALCSEHGAEFEQEQARHASAMLRLRTIKFEQLSAYDMGEALGRLAQSQVVPKPQEASE